MPIGRRELKVHRALAGASAIALLCIAFVLGVGEVLSRPVQHAVGSPPRGLQATSVVLNVNSRQHVAGWFSPGGRGKGAVLLLHGVRGDRRDMLGRALLLHRLGYSVLLIDLPAHGESDGDRITFGYREAAGVRAALDYLRRRSPGERIGVIGVSLGAAALVFSRPDPAPSAVVLESMYPTITEAVEDRLAIRFGRLGKALAPVLLWQVPWRLGVSEDRLRPISFLAELHAPVLIIAGSVDEHTPLPETQRIYRAAREPKELWVVEGAAHVNLHRYSPEAYESRVLPFLAKYLRNGA